MWLLDTNAVINYLNRRESPIRARIMARHPDEIVICDIVKAELLYGAYKSTQVERNAAILHLLFEQFSSLPFNGACADRYGKLRADMERTGLVIGPYDLLIASVALQHGTILVTHNTSEFGKVPELRMEDWEQ